MKVEEGGDAGILVSLGLAADARHPRRRRSAGVSPPNSPSASPAPRPIGGADPPDEPPELTATVPDVVGMDAAQAEDELTNLGLRPIPLETESATVPAGQVIEQLPAAGKEVPKTYPVLLLVSTGAAPR